MAATATALDHEVGETLPPQTAHVSHQPFFSGWNTEMLILLGNKCILTNMERERGLRRGRRMGSQQDENRLSKVQLTWVSTPAKYFAN